MNKFISGTKHTYMQANKIDVKQVVNMNTVIKVNKKSCKKQKKTKILLKII